MDWKDGFHFDLQEEEQFARETARAFAEKEVLPLAAKIDQEHYFPKELIPKIGELGFFGAFAPEEVGGSGLSYVAYALVIEELAAACASTSIIVSAHNSLCLSPILDFADESLKAQLLPGLLTGKDLGCFALSEPGTGSDAAALTCLAERKGDKYYINGTKNWITNGPEAGVCVLFATEDKSGGYKSVSAFAHRLDLPGIEIGKKEHKLGICGSPTSAIHYNNVELEPGCLIGKPGDGFKIGMSTLNGGRIGVAAQAVGIARAALADALRYADERKTFGKPIREHQSIQNYIAEMICKIDAARYLTLSAARLKDQKKDYIRAAAMAKLFASEAAMYCGDKGIQIHGGYGYVKEFPAERHLRDAKITEIYEGTSEIQRQIIASRLYRE